MEREALFQKLPQAEQEALTKGSPKKTGTSWTHEFGKTPSFALAWIFFSLVISLLLLFHIEGAKAAVWILPLLVVGYGYFLYASPQTAPPGLFPSEQYVRETYLLEEENTSQREQLLQGWHHYVIHEWAHQTPSADPALYDQQLDEGLFAFNIARLQWIWAGKGDEVVVAGFTTPPSAFRVLTYLLWNLIFAWMINRREKNSPSVALSSPA